MALPDFLVIGAPKAGTTALHAALARAPGLYMSPVKEPKFFLTDGPPPAKGGPGDALTYREHVWRRAGLRGAVRPGAARHAARRVDPASTCTTGPRSAGSGSAVPRAKLIVVLRDPVERAHSNWTHLWSAGPGAGRRLRPRLRRGGAADRGRLGAASGTTPGWAGTASSSSTCSRCSRASRCWCSATGSWWTGPPQTLDRICGVPRRGAGGADRDAAGERDRPPGADPRAPRCWPGAPRRRPGARA